MKKKFTFYCSLMLVIALAIVVVGSGRIGLKTDVSTATAGVYNAEASESTTKSIGEMVSDAVGGIGSGAAGALGDVVSNVAGGIGSGGGSGGDLLGGFDDVIGGIGSGSGAGIGGGLLDTLGGLVGGLGGLGSGTTAAPTYNNSYIDPIPQATEDYDFGINSVVPQSPTQVPVQQASQTPATTHGETVDYAATSNPYQKPESDFVAGDSSDGIKWLQWIFIYTHYGLRDDGITGVLDTDTVAVVKKLQQENKLTIDGNINADVIAAAEVLYFQYTFGSGESVQASDIITVGTTVPVEDNGSDNSMMVIIVIVIAIVWILAIGAILVLFIIKKKKMKTAKKNDEANANETGKTAEQGAKTEKSNAMSLSDLFEDANKE